MQTKSPAPVAFCWLKGIELSRKNIEFWGCRDPEKQVYGVCHHFMQYGDKQEALDTEKMQDIYNKLIRDLAARGVRIEGHGLNLVQLLPGGPKIKISFDDAEKARREKIASLKKCN